MPVGRSLSPFGRIMLRAVSNDNSRNAYLCAAGSLGVMQCPSQLQPARPALKSVLTAARRRRLKSMSATTDRDTISVGMQCRTVLPAEHIAQRARMSRESLMFTFHIVVFVHGVERRRKRTMTP